MKRSLIWHPVYDCEPDTERVVIIQTDILDEPTLGYYDQDLREWKILDVQLAQETNKNGPHIHVTAWMEMPPKYTEKDILEFRHAAETRYFMTLNSKKEIDVETLNFYKIRRAIRSAAERGLESCRIQLSDLSETIIQKLEKSGYKINFDMEDNVAIISWI